MSKLNSILWFLKRPLLLPQAWEIFKRRIIYKNDELGKEEALRWAKASSIPQDLFLQQLDIKNACSFEEEQHDNLLAAKETVAQCKMKMGGAGALNIIYNLTKKYSNKNILETGVAYGWSSLAILSALQPEGNGHLISIDMPYVNMNNESAVGIAVPEKLKKFWTLIRKADKQGIPLALKKFASKGGIDLIHYDSDKSYSGRMWAYPLLWSALNQGGVLISDDIQDNTGFKDFCTSLSLEPVITESEGKFVGAIYKG